MFRCLYFFGILFFQTHLLHAQSLFTKDEINKRGYSNRFKGPKVDIFMVMKLKEEIETLKRDVIKLTNEMIETQFVQSVVWKTQKPDSQVECFANFCFIFSNYTATWTDAQSACNMFGGYLAEPDSAEIDNQLQDIIAERGEKLFWFGGSDIDEEGTWKWMHEVKRKFTYNNWHPREPNDYNNEDCLVANWQHRREWSDYECKKKLISCAKNQFQRFDRLKNQKDHTNREQLMNVINMF